MTRESILKSVASALQPESLDLTQFARARVASLEVPVRRIRADDAAGALAFAALDQFEIDGEAVAANEEGAVRLPGDPLLPLLLRLKYADQMSRDIFNRAHLLLVNRHGGLDRRESETLFAVAFVALFEWVNDSCPTCRGKRHGVKVSLCTGCRPSPETCARSVSRRDERGAVDFSPAPGCPKCKGMGRIFQPPKAPRGLRCVSCHNTGRKNLLPRRRGQLVSEYLVDAQRARGEVPRGISTKSFHGHWAKVYHAFLDVLRSADRRLVEYVDLREKSAHHRGSVVAATEEEEQDQRDDAPAVEESPTAETLQQPTGNLPPNDS